MRTVQSFRISGTSPTASASSARTNPQSKRALWATNTRPRRRSSTSPAMASK